MQVSVSGFYGYLRRGGAKSHIKYERLLAEIRAIHVKTRETYGAKRTHNELRRKGIVVSLWQVRQLRILHGIRCKQVRKFKATTDSRHSLPVADNLLQQYFTALAPNQIWVSDMTYIWTMEGWLYLAGIKDLCTREIVGYSLSERMTRELVISALDKAIFQHSPEKGLIIHSDRGSQYCSYAYVKRANQYGLRMSMSRKGNCYDNAPMESFWGLLKNELIHHRKYRTRNDARREITEYIEIFYNCQRSQAKLGYVSPVEYFNKLRMQKKLAA